MGIVAFTISCSSMTKPWRISLLALACGMTAGAWARGLNPETDISQNPAADARWLTLMIEAHEGLELAPVSLEFEARKCEERRAYGVGGQSQSGTTMMKALNFEDIVLERQPDSHRYKARIALDAGGPCQWQLKTLETFFTYRSNLPQVKGQLAKSSRIKIEFRNSKKAERAPNTLMRLDYFPVIFLEDKPAENQLRLRGKTLFFPPDFDPSASGLMKINLKVHEDKVLKASRNPQRPSSYLLHYPDGSTLATTTSRDGVGVTDARMFCLLSAKPSCDSVPEFED